MFSGDLAVREPLRSLYIVGLQLSVLTFMSELITRRDKGMIVVCGILRLSTRNIHIVSSASTSDNLPIHLLLINQPKPSRRIETALELRPSQNCAARILMPIPSLLV